MQCAGDLHDHVERRIARPRLDACDVRTVESGSLSELLLCPAPIKALLTDLVAERAPVRSLLKARPALVHRDSLAATMGSVRTL